MDLGRGEETTVLLAGMVGGVEGYRRLTVALLARGQRVVIVDPYRLSIDSTDVSFAAMARRVDVVLGRQGVTGARVVGHAHGAGVALRLAASFPERVAALYFLDAGALATNGTTGLVRSLRIARLIAHLPVGRRLIRGRFVAGLRENAVRHDWLDSATVHAYVQPLLDHLDRVHAFAVRLSRAEEPEPLLAVLSRVRVPVVAILPGVPTPSGAGAEELAALPALGPLLTYDRVEGVGHFLHEEAPAGVAHRLLAPRVPAPDPRRSPGAAPCGRRGVAAPLAPRGCR